MWFRNLQLHRLPVGWTLAADMQMEADFAIMSGELARMIPALVRALGGEVESI